MKVRDVVAQLLKLPQDHELMDGYAERIPSNFYVSSYDDSDGEHEYVAYDWYEEGEE